MQVFAKKAVGTLILGLIFSLNSSYGVILDQNGPVTDVKFAGMPYPVKLASKDLVKIAKAMGWKGDAVNQEFVTAIANAKSNAIIISADDFAKFGIGNLTADPSKTTHRPFDPLVNVKDSKGQTYQGLLLPTSGLDTHIIQGGYHPNAEQIKYIKANYKIHSLKTMSGLVPDWYQPKK